MSDREPPPGIVTLTTDFGTADGYAGAMKGRILSIAPRAAIVDISHRIEPQNVVQGAWCLRRAVPQFPPGTVHVAVVDPGVGSSRRALVIETERCLLVGPDNGLLSLAAREANIRRVIAVEESGADWRKSDSFDGLELFAPVGARLLLGQAPGEFGTEIDDWQKLETPPVERVEQGVVGQILFFDRFGNAVANIAREELDGTPSWVEVGEARAVRIHGHYAALAESGQEAETGGPRAGAFWNSDGLLEIAVYRGSARERLGLEPGTPVRVLLDRD